MEKNAAYSRVTQFFVHLILRIIENPLTRAFADDCQLHQLRRPGDVVWDAVRDGDDEAQRPIQHHRDVLTDDADSRRRKLLWVDFLLSWVLAVQRTVISKPG